MSIMAYLPSSNKVMYFCAAVPTLLCLSFFTETVLSSTLLQMAATAIVRFLITTYGTFYVSYYINNLPKKVEGTAAGMIESLGSLGKVVAPYAIRFSSENGINVMGLFGVIYFLIGFIPLFFLPSS